MKSQHNTLSRRLIFESAFLSTFLCLMGIAPIAQCATPSGASSKGAQLQRLAKVSMAKARKIALNTYSGKIVDSDLERERGGSGLRYSFVIRKNGQPHEVGVDAITGKVLEDSIEGPNAD